MKKIVISTFGSFGDLHPYIAVALELKRRGHRPVIATSEIYREKTDALNECFISEAASASDQGMLVKTARLR